MYKLLIITRDQDKFEESIRSLNLKDLGILAPKSEQEIEHAIHEADIILGNPTLSKKWINKAKKLKWFQSTFAGIDALNADGLNKGYILTNVRDTYGQAIAEYVFSYILYFHRNISENIDAQNNTHWLQRPYGTLEKKVIGILGTGSIGCHVANIAKSFNMNTIGYRKSKINAPNFDKVYTDKNFNEFLGEADYIVNILPHTHDTIHIINSNSIQSMKDSVIFINVGRGSAVNEGDLLKAVRSKKISKAVLDVFDTEPLDSSSELWLEENIYITPHVSGYIISRRFAEIFKENYHRFCKGEDLMYEVDFDKGY